MSPFRPLAVITSIFLAQAALAQTGAQEAEPPIDPQAVELLTSAADFLAAQPVFSFDWFVSYDDVIDGREKLTFTRSGSNLTTGSILSRRPERTRASISLTGPRW